MTIVFTILSHVFGISSQGLYDISELKPLKIAHEFVGYSYNHCQMLKFDEYKMTQKCSNPTQHFFLQFYWSKFPLSFRHIVSSNKLFQPHLCSTICDYHCESAHHIYARINVAVSDLTWVWLVQSKQHGLCIYVTFSD